MALMAVMKFRFQKLNVSIGASTMLEESYKCNEWQEVALTWTSWRWSGVNNYGPSFNTRVVLEKCFYYGAVYGQYLLGPKILEIFGNDKTYHRTILQLLKWSFCLYASYCNWTVYVLETTKNATSPFLIVGWLVWCGTSAWSELAEVLGQFKFLLTLHNISSTD